MRYGFFFLYKKVDEPTGIKRYRGKRQHRGLPQKKKNELNERSRDSEKIRH